MTESLQENLEEIELILKECGAETVRTIRNARHVRLEFIAGAHQMMMPFTDGGTILIARFPPPPASPAPHPVLSGKCPVNVR